MPRRAPDVPAAVGPQPLPPFAGLWARSMVTFTRMRAPLPYPFCPDPLPLNLSGFSAESVLQEAPRQCRHHRARRPWQDLLCFPHHCHHQGLLAGTGGGWECQGSGVRRDRQGSEGESHRNHHLNSPALVLAPDILGLAIVLLDMLHYLSLCTTSRMVVGCQQGMATDGDPYACFVCISCMLVAD